MKRNKRVSILTGTLLVMIMIFTLSLGTVMAAPKNENKIPSKSEMNNLKEDSASGEYDTSIFLAGQNPNSDAIVHGILFVAGNGINAGGTADYTMAAGNTVIVPGTIEKDGFMAGRVISVNGDVGRDVYCTGQEVIINGNVKGNVYSAACTVTINGKVDGDIRISAQKIIISDGAKIGGTIIYNSSADVTAPDDVLSHSETYLDADDDAMETVEEHDTALSKAISQFISFLGLVLIAMLLLWITPLWNRLDQEYEEKSALSFLKVFGIGLVALITLPIVAVLCMVSQVGMRLGFVLIAIYIACIIVAPIFGSFFVGNVIWRKILKKDQKIWAEIIIGIAVVKLIGMIPYLGFVVSFILVSMSFGFIIGLIANSKKTKKLRKSIVE